MVKIFYLDDNNNIVSEEDATHFVVSKYDENGNLIEESFGTTKKSWEIPNQNDLAGGPSEEIQAILDNITDQNGNYIFRK